jgi:hypothetical protein
VGVLGHRSLGRVGQRLRGGHLLDGRVVIALGPHDDTGLGSRGVLVGVRVIVTVFDRRTGRNRRSGSLRIHIFVGGRVRRERTDPDHRTNDEGECNWCRRSPRIS